MFGEGISKLGEMIDLGAKLGIVQKSGAWFNYGDIRLGQGRDNAKLYLKEHPDVAAEIEKQVRENADRLLAAGKKGTVKPLEKRLLPPLLLKMPLPLPWRMHPRPPAARWTSTSWLTNKRCRS